MHKQNAKQSLNAAPMDKEEIVKHKESITVGEQSHCSETVASVSLCPLPYMDGAKRKDVQDVCGETCHKTPRTAISSAESC